MKVWALVLFTTAWTAAVASPVPIRGIALSLYYEDVQRGMRFDTMVDEIAQTGATHISVIVQWAQPDTSASKISPHPRETPADRIVKQVLLRAKQHGLKTMLFPILWIEKRGVGDWRGTLKPRDPMRWWSSYFNFILHYANIARAAEVDLYSIGSELASMEGQINRWRALARQVRGVYGGELIYSANWDHYEEVDFWDVVDYMGVTGYYRLTMSYTPKLDALISAWQKIRVSLLDWRLRKQRPLIFTELGYPSIDGAARSPWDYTTGRALDLNEQADCYRAFLNVWAHEKHLHGVFFWNWWGPSDGQNTWYTLKGKPAWPILREWIGANRASDSTKLSPKR
ncbi:MAG: hypothetical protein VX589_17850 [Myxococcota bacterium]|nr:hypothetical protein [Myxococcota bacterium]